MIRQLVESVPNVSEGRDRRVIDRLAAGIRAVGDVALLDVHIDPDHHRSVFTIVGDPNAMGHALFGLVEQAQQLINIRRHHGEHPRIGVVDVVPWIPFQNLTMDDCVLYAKNLGARIGQELAIPVFLYEEATVRSSRSKLEIVRQGGLLALENRIKTHSDWLPDYGPPHLHQTAGAIVIGARFFLIAFNVVLRTKDLNVARHIAKTIRTSGGGLPALKAMGVPLVSRGVVQVSMNLADFRVTSLRQAFDAVMQQARRYQVEVLESEIVGLVPQAAWDEHLVRDLKLTPTRTDLLLEDRL